MEKRGVVENIAYGHTLSRGRASLDQTGPSSPGTDRKGGELVIREDIGQDAK